MISDEIREWLFSRRDENYAEFQSRMMPTVDAGTVVGVRTPLLRKYAKELEKREDIGDFLQDLPHRYFDENQLHAFVISLERDYEGLMAELEAFLPYIDNWATCDQLSPKALKKHREELIHPVRRWLESEKTYTVRFGIGMLMSHYLDEEFDEKYLEWVSEIRSEEYYINMMIAWYFATALAKQYDAVLPYLEEKRLDAWTHNKTIQKAVESYRITPGQKEYLKSLRLRRDRKRI